MLRKSAGLSQSTLAKQLHISPSTLGSYEQGRREPSCAMLVTLSNALGVSVDYLLTGCPYYPEKQVDYCKTTNCFITRISRNVVEIHYSEDIDSPLIEFSSLNQSD